MIRQDRIDPKRRSNLDPKRKQFSEPQWKDQEYKHKLNFYTLPPTANITLEQFEEWAINRLKGMVNTRSASVPRDRLKISPNSLRSDFH